MSEIIEEFFQGYCRACDYGTCIHRENCQMMKQVFAFMEQENEKRRE